MENVEDVDEALVVDIPGPGGEQDGSIWLFIVAVDGVDREQIVSRVKYAVRSQLSPRHVPDSVEFIEAVPKTLTGKKCEVPVKRILLGAEPTEVINADSLQDATSLHPFVRLASKLVNSPHSQVREVKEDHRD